MRNKKKRTLNHKSPLVKKLTILLYIVITILSILNHRIDSLSDLLTETIVYTCLIIALNIMFKNISIKQIKEDIKLLFD